MDCIAPKLIWPHRSIEWCDANEEKPVSVRCGKCVPCLVAKRNDWSFRLYQEWRHSTSAHFITLTYDEKHYPGQLQKRDLQLFFKRLRKHDKAPNIRYFAVGEYGTNYGRAHYHALVFNTSTPNAYAKAWQDSKGKPIGIVHVGKVSAASCAYVTKYVIQSDVPGDGREKPFTLMSRKYGIGGKYLTDIMCSWHREDNRNYAIYEGQKIHLPRFYKDKIFYGKKKEELSKASQLQAIEAKEKERKELEKIFGSQWAEKKREAVEAEISRVKQKVKFTQTF